MITVTDLFAGAGGSSTGMVSIPGVNIRIAANHWQLAVDVHNANHPTADHAAADIHQADPHWFPRTDLLWASPECTKWTQASGRAAADIEPGLWEDPLSDEAAQRSRMLMYDVPRFAEVHRYRTIIVENVVDVAIRPKYRHAFQHWLAAMTGLGYEHRVISLNSMHAQLGGLPAPQSRDRLYVAFWRHGDRAPDFEPALRPSAWCDRCQTVQESRQAWKPGRTVGKYRAQYVYVCGTCNRQVEPGYLPAAAAINWALRGQRIGDRAKPLADKTRERIAAGIARYWRPFVTEHTYEYRTRDLSEPLSTLRASGHHHGLAVPVEGREGKVAVTLAGPMRTMTTRNETALVMTNNHRNRCRPTGEPGPTLTTATTQALLRPFVAELRGGGSDARSIDEAMATVCASGNHHGLVAPYYGNSEAAYPTDHPLGTVTTRDRYALIMRNNGVKGGNAARHSTPAGEPMRTLTTAGHQSLITPGDVEAARAMVDDVEFRMFTPAEVAAGMAFPGDYLWEGSNRDRVRMAGNAVTPPASRDLVACAVQPLLGAA